MKLVRAWCTLVFLSFRRLLWSSNTVMVIFPLVGAGLVLLRLRGWMLRRAAEDFTLTFERFSENFVLAAFASFLLPICALAYGTTSIGGDREDRTLLFLLIRPVPRLLILLAKWTATLPLVLGVVVGSFYL
jgi:ABC-type transport system involved in multi-copper enzyme maturation permease subunit